MNSRTLNRKIIKNRIIQSAVAEFSERGFTNARIDSIAAAAGINPSRIYYYTGSKKNLYGYVLSYVFQNVEDRLLQPVFLFLGELKEEPDTKLALLLYYLAVINDHTAVCSLRKLCFRDVVDGKNTSTVYVKKYLVKYLYATEDILKEGIEKSIFEVSDTSMFIINIFSILKNSAADGPVRNLYDSAEKTGIEDLHQHLQQFVFKSLAPTGKAAIIPLFDDDTKKLFAGLVDALK